MTAILNAGSILHLRLPTGDQFCLNIMDLRIATYNIKCFPWTTPSIQEIVTWLTRNADIVAIQEVWCRHALLTSAFATHGWTMLRPSREHHIAGIFGSGLAIAYRADRFQQTDARFYPYLSAVGFDALVTKGWFRVELTDKYMGQKIRIINTHMQSDYEVFDELWRPIAEPVRMAQALQLSEVERRLPQIPTLIVGDMNTEMCWFPNTEWLTHHCGPTFEGTSQVLDHCAAWNVSNWALTHHRVGRECGDWSDHWPVLWRLSVAPRNPRPATSRASLGATGPRSPRTAPGVVIPRPPCTVPGVPAATRSARSAIVTRPPPSATVTTSTMPTTTSTTSVTTRYKPFNRVTPLPIHNGKQNNQ
jgi:endonuclease/exonuclease/phosphatase family metal-dependent hydrolase